VYARCCSIILTCLSQLYESIGVDKSRVFIKLASTWEGIKAAEILQREGIDCNLTLLFSLVQAVAAAEAKTLLISPFVGRIMDWHKAKTGKSYAAAEDPGVLVVKSIFQHYKLCNYRTIVMGASFRNVGEVLQLAGCDCLTISPELLAQLSSSEDPVQKMLFADKAGKAGSSSHLSYLQDESKFRFDLNEDAMAVEKLREGISKFSADAVVLKQMLMTRIMNQ
jgi:transaldolase